MKVVRDFPISALGVRDLYVWTPDEAPEGHPIPVVYMQDGQNLFDPRQVPSGDSWGMDGCVSRLIDQGLEPVRIVGIASGAERLRDYAPSAILNGLSAETRATVEAAFGGVSRSEAYANAVVQEVMPFIETAFPTSPGSAGAYLMGASLGGAISAEIYSRFPGRFAGVGCLSAHFSLLPLDERAPPPAAFAQEVADAVGAVFRESFPKADGRRVWIDASEGSIDRFYGPSHAQIARALASLGYREGVDLAGGLYLGVGHDEAAWRARVGDAVLFLLTGKTMGASRG
ncbi:MAG: alpha/beta hydrolase-fold protein [Caulobacteraceae bacterium]|nr:alpha/beta hydrolase-fold protein [Caulobacteraceae bacterium]